MTYRLQSSYQTVQVLSPTLATDALYCTIQTFPSGSIVQRTVPMAEFTADQGQGILNSLADAVENLIAGGLASAAVGTQGIDASGLLFDAVTFTVTYKPTDLRAGTLTTSVEVPVDVLTADTGFASLLQGGSATERLQHAYDALVTMASG